MSFIDYFHKVPAFRLIVPFITGIIYADTFFFAGNALHVNIIFSIAFIFLIAFLFSFLIKKYPYRWISGFLVTGLFFCLGCGWHDWQLHQTNVAFSKEETVYKVMLSGYPEQKTNSLQFKAVWEGKNILLYFPKDTTALYLNAGDELLIYARISSPVGPLNPDEFDYRKYLIRKGISGTGYVPADQWMILEHHSWFSFREVAWNCRQKVLDFYRDAGFIGDNLSILSALTMGYKEELSEEIREAFSVAGVSHVLALSGLHIAIVSGMLIFLFNRIAINSRFWNTLRVLIILLFLWFFAFITGLSTSVVRSVIMFSLLIISQCWNRQYVPVNTLLFTALFMLCFYPGWLFDVGFQLSFVAVIGILVINPWLSDRFLVKNVFLRGVWGAITVSVSTQLVTTPLVLFYFSNFPTHFLVTNFLVVPLLIPLILYVAVAMLILTPIPVIQSIFIGVLQLLLSTLTGIVRRVQELPYSSFDGIWIYPFEVILIYLLLILLVITLQKHEGKYMLTLFLVNFLLVGYRSIKSWEDKPGNSIVFYHLRHTPTIHCISSDGASWLSVIDSIPDTKQIKRSLLNYWNHIGLDFPDIVSGDYKSDYFIRKDLIVSFGGKRIVIAKDHFWLNRTTIKPFPVDYLYICKGYDRSLFLLAKVFQVEQVILDVSLSEYHRKKLEEECKELDIPFHSLREGFLKVEL